MTGAAKGLGAEFVRRLAADGWEVVGVDVDVSGEVPVRRLDVTDVAAVRALAREVQPDLWVNNAGILGPGDAATQPDELVERVVRVNLLGVMNGTRAAVEVMRQRDGGRGRGHVINVGSLASWVPVPGECVYAATKAGVLSFTLGLAGDLKTAGVTGIELTVVCPDGMLTPMIQDTLDDPAVALSFSGLRMVTPEAVVDRALSVLRRPRKIVTSPGGGACRSGCSGWPPMPRCGCCR